MRRLLAETRRSAGSGNPTSRTTFPLAVRRLLAVLSAGALALAIAAAPADAASVGARTWQPFVLVVGLLLVGQAAHAEGTFERAAAAVERVGGGPAALYVALLALAAVATTLLNLDTSVAFLTPVLVLAARRRGLDEEPFIYGSLFMANAASLLLPGSNLTNLLVLAGERVAGATFAARMLPAWGAAVLVTTVGLWLWHRQALRASSVPAPPAARPPAPFGTAGLVAIVAVGVLVVGLRSPAVPVLTVGALAVAVGARQGRLRVSQVVEGLDFGVLAALFALAVALGTLGRVWSGPGELMADAGRWGSAAIGAAAAVLVNNLPAAVLLSAKAPAHPRALLIGLDLGPNLAVTGSLSAVLWYRAARTVGCRPSVARVSSIGLVLAPCSIVAALVATSLLGSGRL
jgi:arsenical pump membrane protein